MTLHRKAIQGAPAMLFMLLPTLAAGAAAPGVTLPASVAPLPSGVNVVSGSASVSSQGNAMQIVNTPNTILDWQSFSIGTGYSVNFQQASAQSQVVNRVVSQNPSYLLGQLSSNGRVWLLNPNGILFGQNARVDVGSLVASTLRLDGNALDHGVYTLSTDARTAAGLGIVNQGLLSTPYGGQLLLIGPSIRNEGSLQAPGGQIGLLATQSVELLDTGLPYLSFRLALPQGEVENSGSLLASGIDVYSGVINQQGLVQADQLGVDAQGRIVLSASQQLTIGGRVDASHAQGAGGSIALLGAGDIDIQSSARLDVSGRDGGGHLYTALPATLRIAPGASLLADGGLYGKGGRIELWSLDLTRVYGELSARGGSLRGDGGFIETSSHGLVQIGRAPNASAAHGHAGTWLLDPANVDIDSTLAADIIYSLEGGTSVVISTSPCSGCEDPDEIGDITLSSPISVSLGTAVSLSLIADHSIYLNQAISASGASLGLYLQSARAGEGNSALNSSLDLSGGTLNLSGALDLGYSSQISNARVSGADDNASVYLGTYHSATFDAVTLGPSLTVTLDSGSTLNVSGGLVLDGATLQLSTSGFFDDGGITGGGLLYFTGAAQSLSGTGTLSAGAYGSGTFSLYGSIDAETGFSIGPGITLLHQAGDLYLDHLQSNQGLISSTVGTTDYGSLYLNEGSDISWSNSGEIRAAGTNSTVNLYGSWNNTGTLNADQGVIGFASDLSGSDLGTLQHGTTGYYVLATGRSWDLQGGSVDLDGMGRLLLAGGLCEDSCPNYLRNGTLSSSSGEAQLDLGADAVLDGMTLGSGLQALLRNGGALEARNSLHIDGSLDALSNSTVKVHGGLSVNGTLTLASNGYSADDHGASLILVGDTPQQLQGTGEIIAASISDPDAGSPSQASSASISTQAASADTEAPLLSIGNGLQISSEQHLLTIQNLDTNQGTLSADGGRLELSGDGWQNGANGSLNVSSGTLDISGLASNAGTLEASGGSLVVHDPGNTGLSNSGLISASGGSLSLLALGSNSGTLSASSGSLTVTGSSAGFNNAGTLDASGGALSVTQFSGNSGTLRVSDGSLQISGSNWTQTGSSAILVSGGSAQLNGFDQNAGSVTVSDGTLQLSGLSQNSGGINVSGGSLTLTGADDGLANTGSFSVTGGSLSVSKLLSNSGTVAISDGSLQLSGFEWQNLNTGQVLVSGGSAQLESLLSNAGSVQVSGGSLGITGLASNTGSLQASDGTLTISGDTDVGFSNSGTLLVNGGSLEATQLVRNSGTISLSKGTLSLSGEEWQNLAGGQISVSGGSGQLQNLTQNAGTIGTSGNGALQLDGFAINSGTLLASGGSLTVNGVADNSLNNAGDISVTGGQLSLNHFGYNDARISITSGTLEVSGESWNNLSGAQLTVTGGSAELTGFAGNYGSLSQSGGQLSITGMSLNQGTLSSAGGTLQLDGSSAGLENTGTLSVLGGDVTVTQLSANSGTLSLSSGSLDISGSNWQNQSGGEISVTGGEAQFSGIDSNAGSVEVSGGSLVLSDIATNSGSITASGGTLTVNGNSTSGLSNSGSISASGGAVALTAFSANSGTLSLSSGSLDVSGSNWQNQSSGEISVSGGEAQFSGVGSNAGSIEVSGGSLVLSDIATNSGSITASDGTLTVNGNSTSGLSNSGSISASGGDVTITELVSNSSTLQISTGSLDVSGGNWSNTEDGVILVSGGDAQLYGIDHNTGAVSVTGGSLQLVGLSQNGGSITASNGSLTVTGASTGFSNNGTISGSGGTLTMRNFAANSGELSLSAGSLTVSGNGWQNHSDGQILIDGGNAQLSNLNSNAGLVQAEGGTLLLSDIASNSGSINANGGTLTLSGDSTLGLSNSGNVSVAGGDITVTKIGSNSGTLQLTSGSLDVSGSSWQNQSSGEISVSGGAAQLSGISSNAGSIQVSGGSLVLSNIATNSGGITASDGTLTINGNGSSGLSNSGSITASGGDLGITKFHANSGTLSLSAGSLDVSGSNWQNQSSGEISVTSGEAQLSGVGGNAGTIDVSGGSLILSDIATNSGSITASNGVLTVNGNSTSGLSNSGSIEVSGGAVALTAFSSNGGTLNLNSGSLDVSGSSWQNEDGAQILVSGGEAQLSGVGGNAGTIDVSGGSLILSDIATNSGSITASNGVLTVNGNSTSGLSNSGSIEVSGGAVALTAFSSNGGTLNLSSGSLDVSGSSWQNEDGAQILVSGGRAQLLGISSNAGGVQLSSGELVLADAASAGSIGGSVPGKAAGAGWRNDSGGTLAVTAGSAQFAGLLENAGTLDLLGGSTTITNAGSGGMRNIGLVRLGSNASLTASEGLRNDSGGAIRGGGQLDLSGALLRNQGLIAPESSAGIASLTLLGDYEQLSGGVLAIDIRGLGLQDQLLVNGQASLAGTLQVSFASGYSASSGDRFTVMRYAAQSGSFGLQSNVNGLQPQYETDQLTLSLLASVPSTSVPQQLSQQISKPVINVGSSNGNSSNSGDAGLVDATHSSTLNALFTQAGVGEDSSVTPQSYLLTDGERTYFRNLTLEELPREQLSQLLSARSAYKNSVFAEARTQLEDNPQLADLPQCQSLQEAEKGVCILNEDLQKQLLKKRRQPPAAKLQMVAAVPAIARKRALVIGLNHYRDPRVPQLSSAVPDARAVAVELQGRLGYEVLALENPDRAQIVAALNRLTLEMREDDSLLVYFAGHGELVEKTGLGYWIPSDASARDPRGWISNADVARWLRLMQAKQVALVLDSCYSGSFVGAARNSQTVRKDAREAQSYLSQRSVMAMTSGSDEPVADSGNNGHSVFAWSLLQQLRRLDRWAPGNTLFFAVRDEVERELPQTPQYGNALADGSSAEADFLFERRSLLP